MAMDIGVIGLGFMGERFAYTLASAGHRVVVHDRDPDRYGPLIAAGATPASSSREAAGGRDVVITLLPGSAQVWEVVTGAAGILAAQPLPKVVVNCSTISHRTTIELAEACAAVGVAFVDAPVTGQPPSAVFFAGGEEDTVVALAPIFTELGTTTVQLGPPGSGTVGKLVNQQILFGTYFAILEGLVVAAKAGVDPAALAAAIEQGPAASNALAAVPERILRGDLTDAKGAPLALIDKDMQLLNDLVRELQTTSSTATQLSDVFTEALVAGLGDHHFGALLEVIARRSDLNMNKVLDQSPRTSPTRDAKTVVRQFVAIWNAGTSNALSDVMDQKFVWHSIDGRVLRGLDTYVAMVENRSSGKLTIRIDKLMGEGNNVLARLRIERGDCTAFWTHDLFRVENDRIIEEWSGHG